VILGANSALDPGGGVPWALRFTPRRPFPVRDDYLKEAQKVIPDAALLINVVSRRVKQLRRGSRALVESLEKLNPEDIALREIIEGKIHYDYAEE
jgi:DNA-directed RNA polymerase subunit omega